MKLIQAALQLAGKRGFGHSEPARGRQAQILREESLLDFDMNQEGFFVALRMATKGTLP